MQIASDILHSHDSSVDIQKFQRHYTDSRRRLLSLYILAAMTDMTHRPSLGLHYLIYMPRTTLLNLYAAQAYVTAEDACDTSRNSGLLQMRSHAVLAARHY